MRRTPLIRFVGRSGSGKTTLVSKLIDHWSAAGLRVGAIKHASKAFQMDHEGKDTHRFRSSGAAAIAVASPSELAVISSTEKPATMADLASHLPGDLDVIVVEGFKWEEGPTLEVQRGDAPLLSLEWQRLPGLIGVVTDRPGTHLIDVPQLDLDDVDALASFLEARFELRADRGDFVAM